jgi:serine/threonine-protein kinase
MARPPAPSVPPLPAGTALGDRFEVLGILGEGGTGTVYEALRLPQRERVALKVLHGHLQGDRQIRGRFEREARILRRLEGDHVVPVIDSGQMPDPRDETRSLLYMVLPRIDGPALDTILQAEPPLAIDRVFDVMLQVLDGLRMAHAHGVVHRDLKPANVLMRGGAQALVVDFGLAKIIAGDTMATMLTAHNMVCGTPEYMAPEQARGDEIDARCDLYAAGVMLYQLLTGSPPFSGPTPLAILTAHLTSEPERPTARAPGRGISPALEAITLHAMAKDPAARYPTAGSMSAALKHARARPDDVQSVRPEAFRVNVEDDADGHSPTFPMRKPSVRPSRPRPSADPPPARGFGDRGWRVLWIVATLASVAIGVWLSFRAP